ncbi:MAG TPA: putative baseplate assembly protein [Solirubrobacteraceae bacterium]|nr:putative baseplate assembly protein [Solirubrobacteraceae bacterium]
MSAVPVAPPGAPIDLEARRRAVRSAGTTLDGIAFVEVLSNRPGTPGHVAGAPRMRTLLVHLLRGPVPAGLDASRVHVLGGVRPDPRLNPVRVEWAYPADAVAGGSSLPGVSAADRALVGGAVDAARRAGVLVARTSSSGDWSTYVLALRDAAGTGVPDGFDEPLSSEPFRFTVDCPSDLDCRVEDECPPPPVSSPLVDYLARDYAGLRTRLLDRLAALVPGWSDLNSADPLVTVAEAFAYMGDRLTLWQDAVAAEAYLTTARRRTSVRRHARLLDYRMHDGCAARVWLVFDVDADIRLEARTPVATEEPGMEPDVTVREAIEGGAAVFETIAAADLRMDRNALALHAWGDDDACLPAGATSAYVRHPAGADPGLAAGDVLVLAPAEDPEPGGAEELELDGSEARRHAVRLDRGPVVREDALAAGMRVLELHWAAEDALAVPLPISRRAADGSAATNAAAFANVVLAEHAATLEEQPLEPPQVPTTGRYRPRLPVAGVAWVDEIVEAGSAAAALRPDPRRARAQVTLDDDARIWETQADLLSSGRLDAHMVAEVEDSGLARLRFGDGIAGRRQTAGKTPKARIRVGGGPDGNLGAGVLTVCLGSPGGVRGVVNPLPAEGGTAPEELEAVRELAPHAFRTQLRAVTSADHAAVAMENPGVQRAVARRRWTGSWYAQEVTLDLVAAEAGSSDVQDAVHAVLDVRRLAGVDVELAPPVFVPLEIVLGVCVADGYARADVARQLTEVLSAGVLPDGRLGFFHPDRFTFGQSLFLSDLVRAVMAVPGVAWVDVEDSDVTGLRFRRFGRPAAGEVQRGRIDVGAREVLRADSDPGNPENGRVEVRLRGGA